MTTVKEIRDGIEGQIKGLADFVEEYQDGKKTLRQEGKMAGYLECLAICDLYKDEDGPQPPKLDPEAIARDAADNYCRCYRCNGMAPDSGLKCEKPGRTCWKWHDAHKGALNALDRAQISLVGGNIYDFLLWKGAKDTIAAVMDRTIPAEVVRGRNKKLTVRADVTDADSLQLGDKVRIFVLKEE